jgi:hypothetical protein
VFNHNGTVALEDSSITGNTADSGGGISNRGDGTTLTLVRSTISGNTATHSGGGLLSGSRRYGGFVHVMLTQNTVAENTTGASGGGMYNYFNCVTLIQSIVSGAGIGELVPAAPTVPRFQPPKQAVTLAAGASSTLTCQFTVPSSVGAGASICTEVFVGKTSSPGLMPLGYYGPACCLVKVVTSGFQLVPEWEASQRFFAR